MKYFYHILMGLSLIAPSECLFADEPNFTDISVLESQQVQQPRGVVGFFKRLFAGIGNLFAAASLSNDIMHVNVRSQERADCGLHAVFNGKHMFDYVSKTPREQITQQYIDAACSGNFQIYFWKDALNRQFPGEGDTNLLNEQVAWLAHNCGGISPEQCTVITCHYDPILNVQYTDTFVTAIKKLRSDETASHLFIVGNMSAQARSDGHWIAIVAKKEQGKYSYFDADSMHADRTSWVRDLQQWIEKKPIAEIENSVMGLSFR